GDPDTLALAHRLSVIADDNPNLNALHPVRVELDLAGGSSIACDVADVLGSPARPLSPAAARAKFAACGGPPALWDAAMALDNFTNTGDLLQACRVCRARRNTTINSA